MTYTSYAKEIWAILLNFTPIAMWYMTKLGVKNGYQKYMCYNEIELCARNVDTIIDSVANIVGMVYKDREFSL